jgi:2-methylcitrate dehydratase PrpD
MAAAARAPPAALLSPVSYVAAFTDWAACAYAGFSERAAQAALAASDGRSGRVLALGTAGHVLDFDDTYAPGLAHLSAPVAPAALVVGAELDAGMAEVLDAYVAGFEAMGALARASHPALYERGWHPTAVCGVVGAAVAAARLMGDVDGGTAVRLALVRAGGLRSAFGSDAKALQVGAAAAAGVAAAHLAAAGATVTDDVPRGFEQAFGGRWADPDEAEPALAGNWIKAYPCCLQTHSPIETAELARDAAASDGGPVSVTVHPRSRQAAPYDDVADPLEAKFSIPYTVAYTLLHGPPADPSSFTAVDRSAAALARERVRVELDDSLPQSAAVLSLNGAQLARVETALGSPNRPMSPERLGAKLSTLGAAHLRELVESPHTTARELEAAVSARS